MTLWIVLGCAGLHTTVAKATDADRIGLGVELGDAVQQRPGSSALDAMWVATPRLGPPLGTSGDTDAAGDDEPADASNNATGTADDDTEAPGVLGNVGSAVERVQQRASDRFNRFVLQLDDLFAGDAPTDVVNKSYARLRFDVARPSSGDIKLRANVKLRLVLPRTEQRFRVLISSDDDESNERDREIGQPDRIASDEGQSPSLALRFIRSARESSSVNLDVGTRVRDDKLQLFGRVRASYRDDLSEVWSTRVSNNYINYSVSGFRNSLQFDFQRSLLAERAVFFRSSTGFNWRKGRKGAGIGETLGVYAEISSRTALAFEGLAAWSTALNDGARRHYEGAEVRLRFRQTIWRSWFSYEIRPSVYWPSSNGYEAVYGGLLRVEFLTGPG